MQTIPNRFVILFIFIIYKEKAASKSKELKIKQYCAKEKGNS